MNVEFLTVQDDDFYNGKTTELAIISHPFTNDNIVVQFVTTSDGTEVVIFRQNDNGSLTIASFDGNDEASPNTTSNWEV